MFFQTLCTSETQQHTQEGDAHQLLDIQFMCASLRQDNEVDSLAENKIRLDWASRARDQIYIIDIAHPFEFKTL